MAETAGRERVSTLAFHAAVLLLGYLLYRIADPFVAPLACAGVLVLFCYAWHHRPERR